MNASTHEWDPQGGRRAVCSPLCGSCTACAISLLNSHSLRSSYHGNMPCCPSTPSFVLPLICCPSPGRAICYLCPFCCTLSRRPQSGAHPCITASSLIPSITPQLSLHQYALDLDGLAVRCIICMPFLFLPFSPPCVTSPRVPLTFLLPLSPPPSAAGPTALYRPQIFPSPQESVLLPH